MHEALELFNGSCERPMFDCCLLQGTMRITIIAESKIAMIIGRLALYDWCCIKELENGITSAVNI